MFLETQRLVLRKWEEADFAAFYSWAADSEMCRMLGRPEITDEQSARRIFDWLKDREPRGYAILLKETGLCIGNLTVTRPSPFVVMRSEAREKSGCALSFAISREYRRRGLMEEAVRAVIAQLFKEGCEYINCGHFDFNLPSAALQRKLGFSHLATETVREGETELVCIENILWKDEMQE